MTGFGKPTRKDHQNFCLNEGWRLVRNARGKSGHHVTFELTLPDGQVLRTRISHPPKRQTYGLSMWAHICATSCWSAKTSSGPASKKEVPQRSRGKSAMPSIPAGVVAQLLSHGVEESEVRLMSRVEAIERLNLIWSQEVYDFDMQAVTCL